MSNDRGARVLRLSMATTMAAWLIAIGALLFWAQFRSFDLLDGGYYFLSYQYPWESSDHNTYFQYVARPIWLLCGRNVIAFRITTLISVAGATWVFYTSLRKRFPQASDPVASGALLLWALAAVTSVSVALTYNSLATIFQLLGIALLLRAPKPGAGMRHRARCIAWVAALLADILATAAVKPPAGLALAAAAFLAIFLGYRREEIDAGVRRVACELALVASILAIVAIGLLVARPATGITIGGLVITSEWIESVARQYARGLAALGPRLASDGLWIAFPAGFIAAVRLARNSNPQAWRRSTAAAAAITGALIIYLTIRRHYWDSSFQDILQAGPFRFFALECIFTISLLIGTGMGACQITWIAIFIVLPLVSSFGTTNTIFVSSLHEAVLFAAAIILAFSAACSRLRAHWLRLLANLTLSATASAAIVSGAVLRPYMFQPSLFKQTAELEVGSPSTTLRVAPQLAGFVNSVHATLESAGFRPGDDVLGFFNLPGLIFAVGGCEPGAPWYFGTWYHGDDTDGSKLRRVSPGRLKRAWVLTQADVTGFKQRFEECGIDFPDGYRNIGSARNPTTGLEVEIWKPK